MLNPSRFLLIVLVCLLLTQSFSLKKKFSEKELEEIEDQWFEDEEVTAEDMDHWQKGPDGHRKPPQPKYKTEMVFVGLTGNVDMDTTSEWAGRQSDILNSGGLPIKAYPVEAGRALFVLEHGEKDMQQVKEFMLENEQVADFEWNQKKYYPSKNKGKKDQKSKKSKKTAKHVDDEDAKIEAIRAALANGASFEEIKKMNEKSDTIDESSLGGAGGPIPAEFPDEL